MSPGDGESRRLAISHAIRCQMALTLEDLVRRAGLQALRESLEAEEVPMRYFEAALAETRPSVTPEMEREYEELIAELKRESPRGRRIGFAVGGEEYRRAAD